MQGHLARHAPKPTPPCAWQTEALTSQQLSPGPTGRLPQPGIVPVRNHIRPSTMQGLSPMIGSVAAECTAIGVTGQSGLHCSDL